MTQVAAMKINATRWQVLQPAIYLISLLPGLVWSVLLPSSASRLALVGTTVSIILIQHGINVLNDAIDWKKGADSQKELSWVHFHSLNLTVVRTHGILSFILGVLLGSLIVFKTQTFEVFYVALPLLALGYGYNASQWTLSYTALGEWVTGFCYGPGVFGCMGYLFLKQVTPTVIFGSLAFGFLAVAVLFSHQPPQVLSDFLAGKLSFAVRHGPQKTVWAAKVLSSLALALLSLIVTLKLRSWIGISINISLGLFLASQQIKEIPSPKTILRSATLSIILGLLLNLGETLI